MNKKNMYPILLGLALSTRPAIATNEVTELRSQLETVTQRLDQLEKDSTQAAEKSSWTEKIKIKGDLRARFEHVEKDSDTTKSRFRGRARIGIYADVNDQVRAGVRIATGSDESPTSSNQDLGEFSNNRAIWLDLMYIGYTPEALQGLDLVLGKIKQPWEQVSDLLYDTDLNPEGLNTGYETTHDKLTLIANLGYYIWADKTTDNPATDITMGAAQLAAKLKLGKHLELTTGANAFIYHNIATSEIPLNNKGTILSKGNTVDGTGNNWLYDYELAQGLIQLDIKNDVVPLKIYGDYIVNMAAHVEENTAWLVGAGAKYKKFAFDYTYRDIEADAVVGVLADGTFAGGGTGHKGHKFKLKYTLLKNWTTGITYFLTEDRDRSDVNTLNLDLAVKF